MTGPKTGGRSKRTSSVSCSTRTFATETLHYVALCAPPLQSNKRVHDGSVIENWSVQNRATCSGSLPKTDSSSRVAG